jgi:DNA-binding GntR family transcriptional regulator
LTTGSNPLLGLEVQLESTAEQVAGAVRDAIIDGRLAQGTYLREAPLSQRFRVSRNTIREATQILVGEGLVTREMHRGAFVTRLGKEDIEDLYRVRRIVELAAVEHAAKGDRSGLHAAVKDLGQASRDGKRADIIDTDLRFHRELVELMGSDRLGALYQSVEGELRLCLALVGSSYEDPAIALTEHEAVLAALDRGDAGRAEDLLAAHLHAAEQGLLEQLDEPAAAPE